MMGCGNRDKIISSEVNRTTGPHPGGQATPISAGAPSGGRGFSSREVGPSQGISRCQKRACKAWISDHGFHASVSTGALERWFLYEDLD